MSRVSGEASVADLRPLSFVLCAALRVARLFMRRPRAERGYEPGLNARSRAGMIWTFAGGGTRQYTAILPGSE
ncbi:MAG TPA: hypothetical protein VJV79_29975 [Polyangiaceae bacterium]|nr:hypothetical protein [Polyangiaceae bacterium]